MSDDRFFQTGNISMKDEDVFRQQTTNWTMGGLYLGLITSVGPNSIAWINSGLCLTWDI